MSAVGSVSGPHALAKVQQWCKGLQHRRMITHSSDAGLLPEVVLIASLSLLLLMKLICSLEKAEYIPSVQQIYLHLTSTF